MTSRLHIETKTWTFLPVKEEAKALGIVLQLKALHRLFLLISTKTGGLSGRRGSLRITKTVVVTSLLCDVKDLQDREDSFQLQHDRSRNSSAQLLRGRGRRRRQPHRRWLLLIVTPSTSISSGACSPVPAWPDGITFPDTKESRLESSKDYPK